VIEVSDLRASLEDAFDESKAANPVAGLRVILRSHETEARRILAGGELSSARGNGRESAWSQRDQAISPADAARLWRQLIDLFDQKKSLLGGSASDQDVFDAMMAAIGSTADPLDEVTSDWSCAGPR